MLPTKALRRVTMRSIGWSEGVSPPPNQSPPKRRFTNVIIIIVIIIITQVASDRQTINRWGQRPWLRRGEGMAPLNQSLVVRGDNIITIIIMRSVRGHFYIAFRVYMHGKLK